MPCDGHDALVIPSLPYFLRDEGMPEVMKVQVRQSGVAACHGASCLPACSHGFAPQRGDVRALFDSLVYFANVADFMPSFIRFERERVKKCPIDASATAPAAGMSAYNCGGSAIRGGHRPAIWYSILQYESGREGT